MVFEGMVSRWGWGIPQDLLSIFMEGHGSRGARFRAEKRSAQAFAHPLSQAQGGLFCVLTVFVCCWSSE